jgi:hypothetical protein
MTVYADNAHIPATVGRHTSSLCHLTADSPEELHEFAGRLGLRRSYFQPGQPRGDGSPSPFWHYDVTASMCTKAIRMGALSVPWRKTPGIMRARETARAAAQEHAPDVGRHSWRLGADQSQTACEASGTVAIRREDPAEPRGYRVTCLRGGRPVPEGRVPACGEPQRQPKTGRSPGDLERAERAVRDAGMAASRPPTLSEQTAARLAAAGITSDDPGRAGTAEWNQALGAGQPQRETEAGA